MDPPQKLGTAMTAPTQPSSANPDSDRGELGSPSPTARQPQARFRAERGHRRRATVRSKSAGLRTHALVGLGAATFMLVSKFGFDDLLGTTSVSIDPTRVAAQIVSGIGLLGAGLIFVRRDVVRGLTTASSVWLARGHRHGSRSRTDPHRTRGHSPALRHRVHPAFPGRGSSPPRCGSWTPTTKALCARSSPSPPGPDGS